jgi:hypothetical protein
MKINNRITKLIISAKRSDFEFTHLLIGEKEYEEMKNIEPDLSEEKEKEIRKYPEHVWDLKVIRVNEPEYLEICNVLDKEKEAEKRLNAMMEKK